MTPTQPVEIRPVTLVVVRHAETDSSKPNLPLSAVGEKRAQILSDSVRGIRFTHVIGTHTMRTRQMLETTARRLSLPVVQLPEPGSQWEKETVTDQTSRRAPIKPVAAAAVRALPPGSVALLALNSENIYAIFNELGVPAALPGKPCETGSMCVPCVDNTCYPRSEFDYLWQIVLAPGNAKPIAFTEVRYGQGWRP